MNLLEVVTAHTNFFCRYKLLLRLCTSIFKKICKDKVLNKLIGNYLFIMGMFHVIFVS
jgi:hypothetical protein